VLGGSFSFLRTVNPGSLNFFRIKELPIPLLWGKQFKIKKTPQKPQRNHSFHERICQDPMIFWPVL
jgi:hypothetical protein